MSLTLKIMSSENKGDHDPDKSYHLIGGIEEIKFRRVVADEYEIEKLNLAESSEGEEWLVCVAECKFPERDTLSTYLLTGNCYVMNAQGQTVDTYWPRNRLRKKVDDPSVEAQEPDFTFGKASIETGVMVDPRAELAETRTGGM